MARLNTRTITRPGRTSNSTPSRAELNKLIENKAYELFEKRGHSHGNAWSDWFEAEKLVKKQYGIR